MPTLKSTPVGSRQFDCLCCLADSPTATLEELAEHLKHTIPRGHLMLHSRLRDSGREAAKALVAKGFAEKCGKDVWCISEAGREYLESTDE